MPYSRFPFFYQPNVYSRYGANRPYPNNTWYNQNNLANANSPSSNKYKNSYSSSPNGYKISDNNDSHKNVDVENKINLKDLDKKNNSKRSNDYDSYFFELFGLKLYFDDILLICLIFFLYEEGVKDDELFISLILLLLS